MIGSTRIAAAAVFSLVATSVCAAETARWKVVKGWEISFYPGTQGCQAHAVFDGGTAFFIGYDLQNDVLSLDVSLLNMGWNFVQDSAPFDVTLQFDSEPPWTVAMTGMEIDGFPGLWAQLDARSEQAKLLTEEFTRKHHMTWTLGDRDLGRFTLRGSQRAFSEVGACQDTHAPPPEPKTTPVALARCSDTDGGLGCAQQPARTQQ